MSTTCLSLAAGLLLHAWFNKRQQSPTSLCGLATTKPSLSMPLQALVVTGDFASTAPLGSAPASLGLSIASIYADLTTIVKRIKTSAVPLTTSTCRHATSTTILSLTPMPMMPKRWTRQRGRQLDQRDGRPPTPPPPRLSSTGAGGWTRPPAVANLPLSNEATPARQTYADAIACPLGYLSSNPPPPPHCPTLVTSRYAVTLSKHFTSTADDCKLVT